MDRKSFEEGIILALVSPPIPHVVKKQPIAYSYNGVILPALPEWDREAYPYAVMKGKYLLHLTADKLTYNGEKIVGVTSAVRYGRDDGSGKPADKWIFSSEDTAASYSLNSVSWSNYDIINTADNSVYLAASEPVPVYE